MKRAERRRQDKAAQKQSPQHSVLHAPAPQWSLPTLKRQLQQATSPAEVQQHIAALQAQGLPAVASEELAVYAAAYHGAAASLQAESDVEAVASLVDNTHAWADQAIERSSVQNQRACRSGCAFCCYTPTVLASAAEIVFLAHWLHTHCSSEELDALQQRIVNRLQRHRDLAASTQHAQPLPCPLLQDNQCIAYAARPLKCRGWNSMSREACEQAYGHSQATVQIPADAYAYVMGNAVLNGLNDSMAQAGLDGASYELTSALARALAIPDAVQRWRNGERLFDATP
jgi:Fe-S-cluster containining protein